MEYLHVPTYDDYRAEEIYTSYCTTFPPDERRSEQQFKKLFSNPHVKVCSVLHDLKNIGYIITWELTGFVFIEHFEIFSEFRSLKYGSDVISDLCKNYTHIILEAEPEYLDENARRRICFYRQNGFEVIDENYEQPCYEPTKNALKLWLLANWQPEKTDWIKEEIYDVVYC